MNTMTNTNNTPITLDQVMARGGGVPDEARLIDFKGGRFVIPHQYQLEPVQGAKKLMELLQAMEEDITQTANFEYRLADVQVATARVLRRMGLSYSQSRSPYKMPSETTVKIGFDDNGTMQTTTVPDDWAAVPDAKSAQVRVVPKRTALGSYNGSLEFIFKRYDQGIVLGIIGYVQDELDRNSIYRGHVINGSLDYIDVSQVRPDRVVYTAETGALLNTWALSTITNAEALKDAGMKTKVSMMLAGTYGTGKTEFLLLIAHVAWLHGWTAIFCRPGQDDFGTVLETARMYMKHGKGVLVVAEDVEAWGIGRERMLDMWDGFGSKQDNALFVVTSNFPEKLDPGMLRPGRLDTVIEIGHLDVPSFEKLCRNKLGDMLADDVDFAAAFEANSGYTPAFMVGALESVVRSTISRTGEPGKVTTEDLINAANGFRAQHKLQQDAANRKDPLPTLDAAVQENICRALDMGIEVNSDVDYDEVETRVDSVVERRIDGSRVLWEDPRTGNEIEASLYTK